MNCLVVPSDGECEGQHGDQDAEEGDSDEDYYKGSSQRTAFLQILLQDSRHEVTITFTQNL